MSTQLRILFSFLIIFLLTACAADQNPFDDDDDELGETCMTCTEEEINAPIDETEDKTLPPADTTVYLFPAHTTATGVPPALWAKAKRYYDSHWRGLHVRRYVAMVNLGPHSSRKRFFLLDLKTGNVSKYITTHGVGSDPNRDGVATRFSNTYGSRMSSLGVYETSSTYRGKHGRSLRLRGMEATNSNAAIRAIVIHAANYVSETNARAKPSFGCPALDPRVAQGVINKLRGGAVLVVDNIK